MGKNWRGIREYKGHRRTWCTARLSTKCALGGRLQVEFAGFQRAIEELATVKVTVDRLARPALLP